VKKAKSPEPELATGWPISKVESCLLSADKNDLIAFLQQRYEERFFKPIRALQSYTDHHKGFGFAIMALCSLLIESLQSYRYGLPTTNQREYDLALAKIKPPTEHAISQNELRNGRQAFEDFFSLNQSLFPDVEGGLFYRAIRNGLLHQAQTKDGWRIRTGESQLWNRDGQVVNRTKFAKALSMAFDQCS
jgi:hypothetical protein